MYTHTLYSILYDHTHTHIQIYTQTQSPNANTRHTTPKIKNKQTKDLTQANKELMKTIKILRNFIMFTGHLLIDDTYYYSQY